MGVQWEPGDCGGSAAWRVRGAARQVGVHASRPFLDQF